MNSASEPAPQALTAEIHVLQVGSKSVTLSAAKQLDYFPADTIKPFGRVRINPKPDPGVIEAIGSVDGVLVRSWVRARKVECPGYPDPFPHGYGTPQVTCARHSNTRAGETAGGGRHTWTEYTPSQDLYQEWVELPLIVLAGLR